MTPEQIEILHAEAQRWQGTPFRARSCACGVRGGADCVQYAGALYRAAKHLPEFQWPRYHIDSGSHLAESPLLAFLRGRHPSADHPSEDSVRVSRCFQEFPKDAPVEPGDLAIGKEGRVSYHCAVVLTRAGDITHVLIGRAVTFSSLRDSTYADGLQAVFRPVPNTEVTT